MSLLAVSDLAVSVGSVPILKGISFTVEPGKVLGVIGESGAGKSMTALAIMGLLPASAKATGSIRLDGTDLLKASEPQMCAIRGGRIGMVFQEPLTALDPLQTIGTQVAEPLIVHAGLSRREALAEADRVLVRAGLPRDQFPRGRFPHELSGGQRQRVVIAGAIALKPKLLIADEPTTALDVTTQARIVQLFRRLADEEGIGIVFISHDLALAGGLADEIAVMRAGEIVETGATRALLSAPSNDYTRQLLAASAHIPPRDPALPGGPPVLRVAAVSRDYRVPPRWLLGSAGSFRAVDQVSFTIGRGENVGLVGESGSGKSTLARAIMGLDPIQSGRVEIEGVALSDRDIAARRKLQVVFQDPYSSFDPRQRVDVLVTEPLHLLGAYAPKGAERRKAAEAALQSVGLQPSDCDKYIHEFSGGQRQRIAIARALIIKPRLIVLDEAVSALDVSIRAQILDLLAELSDRLEISYLFISHDLSVVRAITDRVLVMRSGQIVESGTTAEVFANPRHPYTRELIAAAPSLERVPAG